MEKLEQSTYMELTWHENPVVKARKLNVELQQTANLVTRRKLGDMAVQEIDQDHLPFLRFTVEANLGYGVNNNSPEQPEVLHYIDWDYIGCSRIAYAKLGEVYEGICLMVDFTTSKEGNEPEFQHIYIPVNEITLLKIFAGTTSTN